MSATTPCHHAISASFRGTPKRLAILAGSLLLSACYIAPRAGAASIYTLVPGANMAALSSGFPIGGTVVGMESTPFSFGTISGTLISKVYQGDSANTYGGLTFTYLWELSSSSSDAGSEFTVGGFAGFQTDVSYNQTGNEIAPSNFFRSGNGNVIHTEWLTSAELPSGDTGALVVIQTDAGGFGNNTGTVTDSTGGTVSILAPVPEPGLGSLLALGFGAFLFRRRASK